MLIPLGARRVTAQPDSTGLNPGNWTASFLAADLGVRVPTAELYRATLDNISLTVPLRVVINTWVVSFASVGVAAEWEPVQPPLLGPSDDLHFLIGLKASGTPPEVTIWLRYQSS